MEYASLDRITPNLLTAWYYAGLRLYTFQYTWDVKMDKSYLYRSCKLWNVRLRVPADVLPILGQREMKASLKSESLKTANRLKLRKLHQWRSLFEDLRSESGSSNAAIGEQAMARRYSEDNQTTLDE